MPKLPANGQPRFVIPAFFLRAQLPGSEPAGRRRGPSCQFPIALPGIGMTKPVELGESGILAFTLIDLKMLHIGALRPDQRD